MSFADDLPVTDEDNVILEFPPYPDLGELCDRFRMSEWENRTI